MPIRYINLINFVLNSVLRRDIMMQILQKKLELPPPIVKNEVDL